MSEKVINKPRCPKCNSTQVYVRLQRDELVCHQCGYIETLGDGEEKVIDG